MAGVLAGDLVCAAFFRWGFGFFTLIGAMIAYPLVFVLGPPLFWLMRRLRILELWHFLLVGCLLGLIGWSVVFWPFEGLPFETHALSYGLFGLVSGLCGAAFFWSVGVDPTRS